MTSQKFIAFIEKLLTKTKTGEIRWNRLSRTPAWASSNKSFSCNAGDMDIKLCSDEDCDSITFYIAYDSDMPTSSIDVETDEERQVAIRLINYIYDLFPNLEKAIDRFLDNF